MKRNFVLLLTTLLMTIVVDAQKWRLNTSIGVDHAAFAVSGIEGGPIHHTSGLGAGLDLEVNCSPVVSVQLGVGYAQQGSALVNADGSSGGSYAFDYLTIPLLLRLKAMPQLHFLAGPQVGFLLSAKAKNIGSAEIDVKSVFKSNDFYAVFGAEYRFSNGVFAGVRYHQGISNIVKESAGGVQVIKNRYYSFCLGYSFNLGK